MRDTIMDTVSSSIFRPGDNCWKVETAERATLLVDYGSYYKALYHAIVQARHSVFIIGWDIDSRIRLMRGKDAENLEAPAALGDLIRWKALQNPDIQIYLNKWNYSLFFAKEREPFAGRIWRSMPHNVHYCVDGMIPIGACHHQKIVVVDDYIAFSGGMDIALNRWDFREHHPDNPERWDPGGFIHPHSHVNFEPYHDIQLRVTGPAALTLGQWARERWYNATGKNAVALQPKPTEHHTPPMPLDLHNVSVAICRTMPAHRHQTPAVEVEPMLLEEIGRAERFIYIENQFLTYMPFAQAINKKLREKPDLKVLAISCDHPKGTMEKKSMWSGRVLFREAVEAGGVGDRFALAYPISRENGKEDPVRIHSKLMIIDDRFLHVGSANINNRSMRFDTECDLVIEAHDDQSRATIASLRNDLIREHTGYETAHIQKLIDGDAKAESFLIYLTTSRQHLHKINDEKYRYERFANWARGVADPPGAFFPSWKLKQNKRSLILSILIMALIAALIMTWKFTALSEYADPENLAPILEHWRGASWFVPAVIGFYIVSLLFFFPLMVLDASIVLALGFPYGPLMAITGASCSATVNFLIGKMAGRDTLRVFLGNTTDKVSDKIKGLNIVGMTIIRMLPLAPYTVVNFVAGASRMKYSTFICASVLALLPGMTAWSFLRGPIIKVFHEPDLQSVAALCLLAVAWLGLLTGLSKLAKRWQARRAEA